MTRNVFRCWLASLLLGPVCAFALEVGEIQVDSALNQLFDARIPLPTLSPEELGRISVKVASPTMFKEFGLERMTFSDGALRLGVLYDLLGRYHHQDLRHATVQQFMRRYQVDAGQAGRVATTACGFLQQLLPKTATAEQADAQVLDWAALLHEIGISVAHSSYHKHSAYILANADMPGFSKMDQARLSRIVLAHRGKLERVQEIMPDNPDWLLIFSLRLAVILHRARDDAPLPAIIARRSERGFSLGIDPDWLEASPLSAAALEEESRQWSGMGMEIKIKAGRGKSRSAA